MVHFVDGLAADPGGASKFALCHPPFAKAGGQHNPNHSLYLLCQEFYRFETGLSGFWQKNTDSGKFFRKMGENNKNPRFSHLQKSRGFLPLFNESVSRSTGRTHFRPSEWLHWNGAFVQPHFRCIKNGPKPMLGAIFLSCGEEGSNSTAARRRQAISPAISRRVCQRGLTNTRRISIL